MSREYDIYLTEHRGNVAKGFHWIQKNLPGLLIDDSTGIDYEHQICLHMTNQKIDQMNMMPMMLISMAGIALIR